MKTTLFRACGAFVLAGFSLGAQAGLVASNNQYGVFGASNGQRQLIVDTHGSIADLDLLVSISKCNDPASGPQGGACRAAGNPYENEMYLRLTSPTGLTVNLINTNTFSSGGNGIGQVELRFDDEGAALGSRLQAGRFRPVGNLGAFDGLDMFGTWNLLIGDGVNGDPLEYFYAQLHVTVEDEVKPVSEPPAFRLLAIGRRGLLAGWPGGRGAVSAA